MHKFFIPFLLFLIYCTTVHQKIPIGIEKYIHSDGKIILIATAKASENAIQKGIPVMMENTSKEAALLLIKAELNKPEYSKIKDKFQITYIEYINNGEYCKIQTEYNP